jgi:tetratricopeptide (TPR) repeat protein
VSLGEPELAIKHLRHAMLLSPFDPLLDRMQAAIATAHFFADRYDEASLWAGKALREQPTYSPALRTAAASNALAGRTKEAENAMKQLRLLDPTLRISNLLDRLPLRRPEDVAKVKEGMRRAGLPE